MRRRDSPDKELVEKPLAKKSGSVSSDRKFRRIIVIALAAYFVLSIAIGLPLFFVVRTAVSLNPNAYLQYRAVLESEDAAYGGMYNGQRTACSPEIQGISFARVNYDTSVPSIANSGGATPYFTLSTLTPNAGRAG